MIHQTNDRGPKNGWRCHKCQWHTRAESSRLMDIQTLVAHGQQHHYLLNEQLNEFVHEALWDERIPETSMLGQGYCPAQTVPEEEYSQMRNDRNLLPIDIQRNFLTSPLHQVLPDQIGVAIGYYNGSRPSTVASIPISMSRPIKGDSQLRPIANSDRNFGGEFARPARPKTPSQLSRSTRISEVDNMLTRNPHISRSMHGTLHTRANSTGSRQSTTGTGGLLNAASMPADPLRGILNEPRESSVSDGHSIEGAGSYTASTSMSPSTLGGGVPAQIPKRRRTHSQLSKIAMQESEEVNISTEKAGMEAITPNSKAKEEGMPLAARAEHQVAFERSQTTTREQRGSLNPYQAARPTVPAFSSSLQYETPRPQNPAFNKPMPPVSSAVPLYRETANDDMSSFTFANEDFFRAVNYTGKIQWANGAGSFAISAATPAVTQYSPFMGSGTSSGPFSPTLSNDNAKFQFSESSATLASQASQQSTNKPVSSIEAPGFGCGLDDLFHEIEMGGYAMDYQPTTAEVNEFLANQTEEERDAMFRSITDA